MYSFASSNARLALRFATIIAMASAAAVTSAEIVVDEFNDLNPGSLPDAGPGFWQLSLQNDTMVQHTETGISSVLGSTRILQVTGHDGYGDTVALFTNYDDGALTLNLGPTSTAEMSLIYNSGGTGLDTDLSTGTKLSLDWDPDHVGFQQPTILSFTIDDGTRSASVTQTFSVYERPEREVLDFAFADFLSVEPDLDLTSIDRIQFDYDSDLANDAAFFGISTDAVPEPTSLLMGVVALLLRRR